MKIYLILFGMGIYHGINPAMGWLLASAIGIKKHSRSALLISLFCLTLGHAISIAMMVFAIGWLEIYIPIYILKGLTVFLLASIGIYHLFRQAHPTWFRIGYFQLILWSFLIATAHGAGMMLIPFILGHPTNPLLIITHTAGYLFAACMASFLFYETMNFTILKKGWINFDLIWAISLIITAVFVLISF